MMPSDPWDSETAKSYDTPGTGMFAPDLLKQTVDRLAVQTRRVGRLRRPARSKILRAVEHGGREQQQHHGQKGSDHPEHRAGGARPLAPGEPPFPRLDRLGIDHMQHAGRVSCSEAEKPGHETMTAAKPWATPFYLWVKF